MRFSSLEKVYFLGSVGSVLVLIGIILSVLHFTKEVRTIQLISNSLSSAILTCDHILALSQHHHENCFFRIFWDTIK